MEKDYTKPFDARLSYIIIDKGNENYHMPLDSSDLDTDVYTFLMPVATLEENINSKKDAKDKITGSVLDLDTNGNVQYDASGSIKTVEKTYTQEEINKFIQSQKTAIDKAKNENINKTLNSIMNPYAMIHLNGGIDFYSGENNLIDKSDKPRWYEPFYTMSITNGPSQEVNISRNMNASNNPTTESIINWGTNDEKGRTPYLFQDFVFCKWWNKIPNNRLITLRRYTNPVLDNLNTPFDCNKETAENIDDYKFPPISTLVTYFGDDTGNNLKDIMKFSTGVPWGEVKAEVWELTSSAPPSTNEVYSGALGGLGLGFGEQLATIANAIGVMSGGPIGSGLTEHNGLPPDPYKDGPYTNRILGIVNRIDTVKKREPGINFEMQGLKIKFSYVARPIGGINSKAVMLDILGNFLSMGSPTAQFFGGAHRSRIPGRRYPASADPALRKLYQGKLFGKDGAINAYVDRVKDFINGVGGIGGFLSTIWDAAKGLLGDLLGSLGIPVDDVGSLEGFKANTTAGKAMTKNIERAITEKMRAGMSVSYVSGMRALLTGEPVGDWHLTIGNPLNPIAMIGNLICTNLEVEIDEEAGFGIDDFPLGWTMTVTLDHGMKRDRDAIESMFNFGNGRIYELPDKFVSSADEQTIVDTASNGGSGNQRASAMSGGKVVENALKGKQGSNRHRFINANVASIRDFGRGAIYLTDFAVKKSNRG